MTTYAGTRTPRGTEVKYLPEGESIIALPLPMRKELVPRGLGYDWGYASTAPALLSVSLCAHALGDDKRALRVYLDFLFHVVASLNRESWTLTDKEIVAIVERIEGMTPQERIML